MSSSIKLKACAKLNLRLEVLGKRPDGYHDLWSVFHLVSLHDELEFEPLENGRIVLTCNNEHLPVNPVRVVFETELGAITMEADVARAPVSAANFLRYVDRKFYDGGMINRAVRPDNTVRHDVEVQVIQFQADPAREGGMFPPIPMERTSVTGLRNVNGALSMARMGPDTGQASFSIVIGDQPEMDFGGKRNPDGQGFAVFGRVVDGWDVVKKIHQAHTGRSGPYQTETLEPPIKILKAYRKEQAKAQIHAPAEARDKAAHGGIQREIGDIVSDSEER